MGQLSSMFGRDGSTGGDAMTRARRFVWTGLPWLGFDRYVTRRIDGDGVVVFDRATGQEVLFKFDNDTEFEVVPIRLYRGWKYFKITLAVVVGIVLAGVLIEVL